MKISVQFFVGQLVYAKVKGYPAWPAFISEIDRNRAKVIYFNWQNECNWLGFAKLMPMSAAREIVERHYDKNVKFRGAVDEMQRIMTSVTIDRGKKPITAKTVKLLFL